MVTPLTPRRCDCKNASVDCAGCGQAGFEVRARQRDPETERLRIALITTDSSVALSAGLHDALGVASGKFSRPPVK